MSNTRIEILGAIGKTDDHNLKMILLLMLGLMEEIGGKIDQIYNNKEQLRESVLNGHAEIHHDDHEWIKKRREDYEIRRAFMDRAKPAVDWVEQRMADEADTKKVVKSRMADIITDGVKGVIWVALGIALALISHGSIILPL